ncbi:MAG: hypothetical protein WBE26_13275 [Phycisphaerae bacterium]
MTNRNTWTMGFVAAVAALVINAPANGQSILEGQTAFDNLDATRGRAPGNMVRTGFARAQTFADATRVPVQITETSRPTPPHAQFMADAIEIVFDQLQQTLLFLGNRLLARAGLAPLLPTEFFFPTADPSGGGSDSTGSDSDDSEPTDRDGGGKPGGR